MFHTLRPLYRKAIALAPLGVLLIAVARPAQAIEAEDILIQYDVATSTISLVGKTPSANILDRTLEPFGNTYINDSGFDAYPSIDNTPPYGAPGERNIRAATIQQIAISPGLVGIYQFDGVTPVFGATSATNFQWRIAESMADGAPPQALHSDTDDPFYLHQHFNFIANAPGSYFFDFQITNLVLTDGTQVAAPSPTFRVNYSVEAAAAPEPASLALGVAATLPLIGLWRRRRRAAV